MPVAYKYYTNNIFILQLKWNIKQRNCLSNKCFFDNKSNKHLYFCLQEI